MPLKLETSSRRCTAVEEYTWHWGVGVIDPNEPDYVPGKGVPATDAVQCSFVAEPDSNLCGKHKFLARHIEEGKLPSRKTTEAQTTD